MSASLEDLIRQCAANGCTHLTVYPVHSADNKTVYWHARATPSTQHRYVHEIDTDIVAAITKVITLMPKAPKRAPSKKGMLDLTATVTPSEEPPIDMDESAERLTCLAEDAETNKPGEPLSGMPPGTDPLDLHDAFGEIDQWLPKT